MSTVRTVITRALKRAGVVAHGREMSSKEASEALAVFNDMLYGLEREGIDLYLKEYRTAEFELSDDFHLFIPPDYTWLESLDKADYQGTWDASANSPSLSSGSGTDGYFYKISTAGSTTIDGEDNWQAGRFALFGRFDSFSQNLTGLVWRQTEDTRAFEGGFSAMLALRLADEFGYDPSPLVRSDARHTRAALFNKCSPPRRKDLYDRGIVYTPLGNRLGEEDLS